MKTKSAGLTLILVIFSVLFSWYAIGALHSLSNDVSLILPANNTITKNVSVIFNCTAASSNTSEGIKNITLWLNQEGYSMALNLSNTSALSGVNITQNASFLFNQFNLSDGVWYWMCKGNNGTEYTNLSTEFRSLIIDTVNPTVTFNTSFINNNTYIDSILTPNLTISWTVNETNLANRTFAVWILNGSLLNATSDLINWTVVRYSYAAGISSTTFIMYYGNATNNVNNSVLRFSVNVSDNASNKGTSGVRTVILDGINPLLSITAPFNGTLIKANATSLSVIFNISHADTNMDATRAIYMLGIGVPGNLTGLANVSFTMNTSEIVNTSQTITLAMNATNQFGDNRVIYFVTRDKAGREVINYTSVKIDFAPYITLDKPTSGTWSQTGANILFNFTAINNDTNVSTLHSCELWGNLVNGSLSTTYVWNTSRNASIGNMGSYNGTATNFSLNLKEGNYTWAVWCNDTTGNNIYTVNRTLYVDTTNPVPSVSVAESQSRSTISLGATVTITCSATDSLDTSPTATVDSVTKPSGTVVSSPGNSFSNIDQTGTYTVSCSATDVSGRSASTTTTFTAEYTSLGGNGGSGGGVSGAATTVKTQTVSIPSILPGSPNLVKLADPQDYSLTQIEIDVANAVSDVKITVKRLTGKPSEAAAEAAPAERLYKYVEVQKTNMQDSDVKQATVSFQVEKSWLTDKGVTKEQIVLKRLKGSSWENMATSITDEDDKVIHYKANTPGLSFFAVAAEEKPVTTTEEAPEVAPVPETPTEELAPAPEKKSRKALWITLAVLLVVVAAAAVAMMYFKKKR